MNLIWKCIDGSIKPEQLVVQLTEEKVIINSIVVLVLE